MPQDQLLRTYPEQPRFLGIVWLSGNISSAKVPAAASPMRNYLNLSVRKADTAQEIFKSGIGSKGVEGRPQQDGWIESRLISFVQPHHGLVLIAQPYLDQGDVRLGGRVLIVSGLQVLRYVLRLLLPS